MAEGTINGSMRDAAHTAENKASQAARGLADKAKDFKKTASDAYNDTSRIATEQFDQLRERSKEALQGLESTVSRRPMLSCAIALGSGLIVGLMMTGLVRRNS